MQVGLADENDLNQLRFFGFQIREHPDLFERGLAEVLRLVDDEQREPAGPALIDEEPRQVPQQIRLASAGRRIETEVEHDGFNELAGVEHRADQPRHRRAPIVPLSVVWSSVVLPDPMSPVMTTNPACPSMP